MSKALVTNAADESQVKAADKKVKSQREQELHDIKSLLKLDFGRRFIWRYLKNCDRISADNSGSMTYFKEGERNISLQIKADVVEADPEALLLMMKEAKERSNA